MSSIVIGSFMVGGHESVDTLTLSGFYAPWISSQMPLAGSRVSPSDFSQSRAPDGRGVGLAAAVRADLRREHGG
jgi:hypothetical protein